MRRYPSDPIQFTRPVRSLALLSGLALTLTGFASAEKEAVGISFQQIGSRAIADHHGDALAITATAEGARLKCGFQKLEGRATTEGLWLESTGAGGGKFQVVARAVGRGSLVSSGSAAELLRTGAVAVDEKLVRFIRPGLVEEYSVSADGVRQDFVVTEKPEGRGELRVDLAVAGAKVEAMPGGARLTLEPSGRKIAYSRMRAIDATGKELAARIEVLISNAKSKKDKAQMIQRHLMSAALESALVVLVKDIAAVYPVRIDPTFSDDNWISMGGFPGANDSVSVAVVDGAGNLYIGGSFNIVGKTFASCIAKWDGSAWSALGSGMSGSTSGFDRPSVSALAVRGSDVFAAGNFTTAGGIGATNIAKWDGSTWSALGSGLWGNYPYVRALAVMGSDLYAGGWFTNAGGIAATNIAKWDGTAWSALDEGLSGGFPGYGGVAALAVSGSDLYAGGFFTNAGRLAANRIAKWNERKWSALGSGMGDYGGVWALAVSGSDLYAGGTFITAGGVPARRIARWDGSAWSALGSSGMGGDYAGVYALAVSGLDLYAGGDFTTADGVAANRIAKWDGSAWWALGSGVNYGITTLAVLGSDLYTGGSFNTAGGLTANSIAKWSGSAWSALAPCGMSGTAPYTTPSVSVLAVMGNDLYAGGDFIAAGDPVATNIAKWDGSAWSALGSGMNKPVYALAASGINLYAGGGWPSGTNYVAKWNGNVWSVLGSGMSGGWGPTVNALAISGTDLYAGGGFTRAGGVAAKFIAKWNGNAWSTLGSGIGDDYSYVSALAVCGSDLYAGGHFIMAGGVAARNIAKWNGNAWSALGSGINGYVNALAVSGSNLYVGGEFVSAGETVANNIAQWDGSAWSALGSGLAGDYPRVYALAVSGSDLYVGGGFTNAGGIAVTNIAKWDGSAWSALGSGVNGAVHALAVLGADLYAGGDFTTAGGKISPYVAKAMAAPGNWLRIEEGVPEPGTNTLTYVGVPNAQYLVQFATNLTTGPWITMATNTVAADGRGTLVDCTATNAQRFYRVRTP